jgi:hypothetical protein
MYIRDSSCNEPNSIRYILVDNPNYINNKCLNCQQLQKTFVSLHPFDVSSPQGATGPLHEPNEIVIPDTNFTLKISYPLTNPVEVEIRAPTSNGFTRSELIFSLSLIYNYIYAEEERTSTPRSYHLQNICTECKNKKPQDFVKECKGNSEQCSICYDKCLKNCIELPCKHRFHLNCINKWIEKSPTCPLCRQLILQCDKCLGTGFIFSDYNGIVIPLEHRGSILNRNSTNGIFGIFGHDLEDLVIEHMHYNKVNKYLSIFVGS